MDETILAILQGLLPWLPAGLWCAWWLWCVRWERAWPVLARGGWVVVVLMVLVSALAWSAVFPADSPLPGFWGKLGGTSALALVALFCGWVQGRMRWAPPEVSFEPAAPTHAPGHH